MAHFFQWSTAEGQSWTIWVAFWNEQVQKKPVEETRTPAGHDRDTSSFKRTLNNLNNFKKEFTSRGDVDARLFFSSNASNHRHNYLRCSEVLTRAYRSLSAWFSLPPRRLVIAVGRLSFPVVAEQVASGETRLSLEFPRFLSFFWRHQNEEFGLEIFATSFLFWTGVFFVSCTRHVVVVGGDSSSSFADRSVCVRNVEEKRRFREGAPETQVNPILLMESV